MRDEMKQAFYLLASFVLLYLFLQVQSRLSSDSCMYVFPRITEQGVVVSYVGAALTYVVLFMSLFFNLVQYMRPTGNGGTQINIQQNEPVAAPRRALVAAPCGAPVAASNRKPSLNELLAAERLERDSNWGRMAALHNGTGRTSLYPSVNE